MAMANKRRDVVDICGLDHGNGKTVIDLKMSYTAIIFDRNITCITPWNGCNVLTKIINYNKAITKTTTKINASD